MFLALYVLTGLGTTVGFHRLFTHRSFETTKTVRATFAILGSMTLQGPVTQWVTDHRKHHALSDEDGDPHSPHAGFAPNVWGALKGFFHAHMGWLFHLKGMERGEHYGKDLYDDRLIRRIDRMYFVWVVLTFAIPFAIGYAVGGASWKLGLEVLVWGGLIRIFAYQHATFSVNSICHMFGRRTYRSRDESRNNWVVAALTFGEGWHNNHHAFPASARHGLDRLQLDIAWITIRTLEKLGLAWNVRLPTESQRVAAAARLLSTSSQPRSDPVDPRPRAREPHDRARPAPERGAVQPPRDQRVGAVDAERPSTLEAAPRARRADPGNPGQVAVPGAVEHVEPLAAESVERAAAPGSTARGRAHRWRPDAPATPIETAPPIENPTSSEGRATRSSAARASAMQESSSFQVLIR